LCGLVRLLSVMSGLNGFLVERTSIVEVVGEDKRLVTARVVPHLADLRYDIGSRTQARLHMRSESQWIMLHSIRSGVV
jgi:hypothetical protein